MLTLPALRVPPVALTKNAPESPGFRFEMLPVKLAVRKAEDLAAGDEAQVELELL